jgi:hypothetical protein
MQTCDIETKINKIYYKLFSLNISILRMGASDLGQVGRWAVSTLGPGQGVTSEHWRYLSPILVSFAINVWGED